MRKPSATKAKPHVVRLTTVCAGQIFGEEDVVNERNYTTTVKCITAQGVLYAAKADKFINSISKDDRAWKKLIEMNVKKDAETK